MGTAAETSWSLSVVGVAPRVERRPAVGRIGKGARVGRVDWRGVDERIGSSTAEPYDVVTSALMRLAHLPRSIKA